MPLSSAGFFSKLAYSKNSFRNTIRVSNSLDTDQDQHSVGPDLGTKLCKGYHIKRDANSRETVNSLPTSIVC